MTTSTVLVVLNSLWGVVLIGIGMEMVNVPPDTKARKRAYRILFGVFGFAVIVTSVFQNVRSERESRKASDEAHRDQLASQNKLSYMQGTLDAIARFESQYIARPPKTDSSSALSAALAILKMAQPNINFQPPRALSAANAKKLRDYVVSHADEMAYPRTVRIEAVMGDDEAFGFAKQIGTAFVESGWSVAGNSVGRFPLPSNTNIFPVGVTVNWTGGGNSDHVGAILTTAFEQAGIALGTFPSGNAATAENPPSAVVVIRVWSRY